MNQNTTHKLEILDLIFNDCETLDAWTAIQKFGCTKLSTRAGELIRDGWPIGIRYEKEKNRNGHMVSIAKYYWK